LWLTVAVCALLAELATVVFVIPGRFSVGFYLGRIFSVVVSTAVLNALFWEPILLKTTDTRRERVCFGLIAKRACAFACSTVSKVCGVKGSSPPARHLIL
jgi:hypothetical protein